ncbi:hypothetical protein COSHB9_03990 [Companilactobacillus alimentarius]
MFKTKATFKNGLRNLNLKRDKAYDIEMVIKVDKTQVHTETINVFVNHRTNG